MAGAGTVMVAANSSVARRARLTMTMGSRPVMGMAIIV